MQKQSVFRNFKSFLDIRFHLFYRFLYSFIFILSIIFSLGYFIPVQASFEVLPVGGRAPGMGSAYVAVAEGPESVFFNPAGLSQTNGSAFCFFVARPFGIKELTYETASFAFPTPYGKFGLSLQSFGCALYRENTFAIGWGNRYREKLHYGFLIRMLQLQIQKYGTRVAFAFDVGCLLKLTEKIVWGIAATNINQSRMGERKDPLPQVTRTGLSYTPVQGLLISFELDKDVRYPVELRAGIEIRPISAVSFRGGFGRDPSYFTLGIGISWHIFSCDYGLINHPVLGATHQGSFSIDLNPTLRNPFRPFL